MPSNPRPFPKPSAPIGVFDSGLGGLTVVREIHRQMPREDLVYLGDTARVPYGTKSPSTVIRYSCEIAGFLQQLNVKAIVVACNSASAWAMEELSQQFQLPVYGVIDPGSRAALAASRNRRIGVIGTNATIKSRAYDRTIQGYCPEARVFGKPCPLLVPLVEEAWTSHPVTLQVLGEYLRPILRRRIDTLVLGCTHYPILKPALRKSVGRNVRLVDSAESCAAFVRDRLAERKLLNGRRRRPGTIMPLVTDEPERFAHFATRFLGCATQAPERVDVPPLPFRSD